MSHAFNSNPRLLRRFLTPGNGIALSLAVVAVVGCALLTRTRVAHGANQDLAKLNRFVQTGNTPAMKMFRLGRDLIENEEWAKAAETFKGFVNAYPRDNDVDAALYWYAYALKRQGNPKEAAKQLKRLVKDFERSGWRDEADAMLAEIAPALGETQIIDNALGKENEELKIIALQSLFESSPERALGYVAEWLKPNSTASRRMKESAVSLLGAHGGKEAIPILLDIARNQPDAKLRQTAIHRLGEEGGEAVIDDLMQIYAADREGKVKQQILHALGEMDSPRAHAKLLDIARNASEPVELRRAAIHRLGESDDAASLGMLISLYDGEPNAEIKRQLIHAFGESKVKEALRKLMQIARSDASLDLRRAAIHRIGESRDPDALRFLEDILKP